MSKSIILTPTQIKALESGATMFIISINKLQQKDIYNKFFINNFSPIQKGDKDIFVQEEFATDSVIKEHILYESNFDNKQTFEEYCEHTGAIPTSACKMTKEQSRYSFSECIDVRVVRVKDIKIVDISRLLGDEFYDNFGRTIDKFYNKQMQELNINRTYEDNDYVFLIEFKR